VTLRSLPLLALLMLGLSVVNAAAERPGGGETYSSGRSSDRSRDDTSSRDDDDGDGRGSEAGAALLIWLVEQGLRHPGVGGTLLAGVVAFFAYAIIVAPKKSDWDSISPTLVQDDGTAQPAASAPSRALPACLDQIGSVDPDFSPAVFEDFAFRLYATAQRSRGEGTLHELAPYLAPAARGTLAERLPVGEPVTAVVVGGLRWTRIQLPAPSDGADAVVTAVADYEANYTTGGRRHFAVEEWCFQRAASARTRPPEPGRRFPCPKCGAPWRAADASATQKCAFCGAVVDNGRFDWQVATITLREERDSLPGLDAEVPERGTDAPTRRDDAFGTQWQALVAADPATTAWGIGQRLGHIYAIVNQAWTARNLAPARAVLSDGLADYLQYWIDAYAEQGLHNVLEGMHITDHVLVKLRRDRYYDALTIRLWATGKDCVVRVDDGAPVRGSRAFDRAYSEYWTLIRARAVRGAARADSTCGSCGAALTVTMAGACAHCGAHVTAGEFDWVLSKIEQDDSYRG
jgi:predicted lipid-binding transport protein (Tim44 family)